ncbi:MAG: phosphotransferase, partial [Castellaniella sp.]
RGALRALVALQRCPADGLSPYDEARLLEELAVFPHWFLRTHLGHTPDDTAEAALANIFDLLARRAAAQPRVLVHRDFHSPNLMLGADTPDSAPGIIDFQDALSGPISYDIASLAMDARTTWDEARQLDWAIRYWEYARAAGLPVPEDFASFHVDYEWMGLQRNLRILGVFARLSHRDGKHHYLDHIPRVLTYVRQVAGRYAVFHPLLRLLDQAGRVPRADGYSF